MRRGLRIALTTGVALLATAPAAQADHHFVSIVEVFPGTTAAPGTEFVQIQLYANGQNNFDPAAELVFKNSLGAEVDSVDLPDVAIGTFQHSLLAGTTASEATFTVQNDVDYAGDFLVGAAGGVCLESSVFDSVDCVSWGAGTTGIPGAGTPAPAIPDGSSLSRSILRGCNTRLDSSDDDDSSVSDFSSLAIPTPVNNAATPTENSCPDTEITKTPLNKTKDRTPTFKFTGAPSFECNLDDSGFEACASPFKPGKIKTGPHNLAVRAVEADGSIDPSPDTHGWIIKKKRN